MTKGIRSYGKKQRREVRRQNHVARDLWTPRFGLKRIENKKKDQAFERQRTDFDEDE